MSNNGEAIDVDGYRAYHGARIERTLAALRELGSRRILEVGSYPWVMTGALLEAGFDVCAAVSAAEETAWPDDIGLSATDTKLESGSRERTIRTYSANVERRLFDVAETPDTVLACEIVEHLVRAPHVLFLNVNRWLLEGGHLLVTTPNGAQFQNPLRRRSPTAAYRAQIYDRHSYLYTLPELLDLISLCGFRIVSAGYWNVYRRQGPSAVYDLLARLPLGYLQDRFQKTIAVVARKERSVAELERCPRALDPRGDWEYIRRPDDIGSAR